MEHSKINLGKALKNDVYSLIEYDYPGLIGVETATSYWGLSTFNPSIPIFLVNDNSLENDGYFCRYALSFLFVPNVNTENIIKLSNNLSITDREQTIIDMLRYNRHEFHLYETVLCAYDDKEVNIQRLESLAKQYNIFDKLQEVYSKAQSEE